MHCGNPQEVLSGQTALNEATNIWTSSVIFRTSSFDAITFQNVQRELRREKSFYFSITEC